MTLEYVTFQSISYAGLRSFSDISKFCVYSFKGQSILVLLGSEYIRVFTHKPTKTSNDERNDGNIK